MRPSKKGNKTRAKRRPNYQNEGSEKLFDDVAPEDGEDEYEIAGTNYRNLTNEDVGYSDNFKIEPDFGNPWDEYAVKVFNSKGSLVGYLMSGDNEFWHTYLSKKDPSDRTLKCRGYIGRFRTEKNELKFYGRVYLPEEESVVDQPNTENNDAMKNANFVAVDFETATQQKAACQIGVVVVKEGEIVKKITRLIQPPRNRFTPSCVAVHGITPSMTADAPTFDVVWSEVKEYFEGNFIVGHNVSFDLDVLEKSLRRYSLPIPIFMGTACTYNLTHQPLEEACSSYGVPLSSYHDAGCDAEASARLFLKYLNGEMSQEEPAPECGGSDTLEEETKGGVYFHEQLRGDVLKKDLTGADPGNLFYDKKVVITGVFEIDRAELADRLKKMGADIDTGITKRTDYVLTGQDAGPKKLEKIKKLQDEGAGIRQIFEPELKEILAKYQ